MIAQQACLENAAAVSGGFPTPRLRHGPERSFSGGEAWAAATFLDVQINSYVVMTVQLFRVQVLAARAVGDADKAEAFEAAIGSLLEDAGSSFEHDPARRPVPAPN